MRPTESEAQAQSVGPSGSGFVIGTAHAETIIIHNNVPEKKKSKPRLSCEPELVLVPSGSFWMGSAPSDGIPAEETPRHQIDLAEFMIARTPTTNQQYMEFVHSTCQEAPKGWLLRKPPPSLAEHPVAGVSWDDAVAYCRWLSQQSGCCYRLPSEAEWEKAARSDDDRIYPWGNAWQEGCCNSNSAGTTPVGTFPKGASPFGCLDMLGNVREWTSTIWDRQFFYPFRRDGRDDCARVPAPVHRIHRGGGFGDSPQCLRCAARGFSAATSRFHKQGFRIVMEIL